MDQYSDYKSDLKKELLRLKEKDKNLRKRKQKLKKVECRFRLNNIKGENKKNLLFKKL